MFGTCQKFLSSTSILNAKQKQSRAKVAIKVIYKDVDDPFLDVAKLPFIALLESMRHFKYPRHVVKHVECVEDDQYVYIVSGLMNCGDLASFMKSQKVPYLREDELQRYAHCIVSALHSVHERGFLHNDLQPCNIYLHKSKKQIGESSHSNDSPFQVKLAGFSKCEAMSSAAHLATSDLI